LQQLLILKNIIDQYGGIMRAVTVEELLKISGMTEKDLALILNRYNEYLPAPLVGGLNRVNIIPSENTSLIMSIYGLLKIGRYSDKEIEEFCKSKSYERIQEDKREKQNISELLNKLDDLASGYIKLRDQYVELAKNNSMLIGSNKEIKEKFDCLYMENQKMKGTISQKNSENESLNKKITQLAGMVLSLKKENTEFQHIMIELERRLEKESSVKNMKAIEERIDRFENTQNTIMNTVLEKRSSISKKDGFFSRIKNWVIRPEFQST